MDTLSPGERRKSERERGFRVICVIRWSQEIKGIAPPMPRQGGIRDNQRTWGLKVFSVVSPLSPAVFIRAIRRSFAIFAITNMKTEGTCAKNPFAPVRRQAHSTPSCGTLRYKKRPENSSFCSKLSKNRKLRSLRSPCRIKGTARVCAYTRENRR